MSSKDNLEETKVDLKRGDKSEYFAEKISKIGLWWFLFKLQTNIPWHCR